MKKLFLLLLLFSVTSCGGNYSSSNSENPETPITVHLDLPALVQTAANRIGLRISASDIATPLTSVVSSPIPDSVSFSRTVPIGTSRLFEIFAPVTTVGAHAGFFGKTTQDITASTTSIPVTMNFMNYGIDATGSGDVVSTATNRPDIQEVQIFRSSTATLGCSANSVIITVTFTSTFTEPLSSVDSLLTFIEFDLDNNASTGSTAAQGTKISREITASSSSTNSALAVTFTQGANFYLQLHGPSGTGTTVSITAFRSGDDTTFSGITSTASYSSSAKRLVVCTNETIFHDLDTDDTGSLNVLTGINSSNPNDVAYRSGTIAYQIGLNLDSTSP